MNAKRRSKPTGNDIFCCVVSKVNAALAELDAGQVERAQQCLEDALRLASVHPSHGAVADLTLVRAGEPLR